jgi:hypothetical protein
MTNDNALATYKGLSTLLRPRYTRGLLLEDDDLTAAVDYTRNMMRLLFRSLFGCGVICGFDVTPVLTCNDRKLSVTVEKGVALDCLGNPIEVPGAQVLAYDPDCKAMPKCIWVAVCYLEKCCRPKDVTCSPDEDSHVVYTRSNDGFEIKLYDQQPKCACSCEPPRDDPKQPKPGKCCEDEQATAAQPAANDPASQHIETRKPDPCACYEDHNKGICACDCDCTCVVVGRIDIDLEQQDPTKRVRVNRDIRRFIRPVLVGYEHCKAHGKEHGKERNDPSNQNNPNNQYSPNNPNENPTNP